jgi:hypothetical protein
MGTYIPCDYTCRISRGVGGAWYRWRGGWGEDVCIQEGVHDIEGLL